MPAVDAARLRAIRDEPHRETTLGHPPDELVEVRVHCRLAAASQRHRAKTPGLQLLHVVLQDVELYLLSPVSIGIGAVGTSQIAGRGHGDVRRDHGATRSLAIGHELRRVVHELHRARREAWWSAWDHAQSF